MDQFDYDILEDERTKRLKEGSTDELVWINLGLHTLMEVVTSLSQSVLSAQQIYDILMINATVWKESAIADSQEVV